MVKRIADWGRHMVSARVEDLKSWQELGGCETAISNAKHQLSLLDMAIENKKAAIGILVDLRKMCISEAEVLKLVKVVNSG